MFCLNIVNFRRKVVFFLILCFFISSLLAGMSQRFVYAQGEPSYNLTSSYIVQHGDTLAAIARAHRVAIQDIATTNNIRNINNIRIGQVLIIPNPAMTKDLETVRSNNSPSVSAPLTHLPEQDLAEPVEQITQPLKVEALPVTATIETSEKSRADVYTHQNQSGHVATTALSACAVALQSEEQRHDVRPGDTLYGIARTYGVTATALRQRNALTTDRIRVGECIIVPAGTTTTPVPDRRRSSEQRPVTLSSVNLDLPVQLLEPTQQSTVA